MRTRSYMSADHFLYSPEPLLTEVRKAFADSVRVIQLVLIPFVSRHPLHRG